MTTILAVKRNNCVALAGDGQVTHGGVAMKHGAKKVRDLYRGKVFGGFAGSTCDATTLAVEFGKCLKKYEGDLPRSAHEFAKDWRTSKYLRHLEAQIIVADAHRILILTGMGDIFEPDEAVVAIGSGGAHANAAALALYKHTDLTAREIVDGAMQIASGLCVNTNDSITVQELTEDQNDE